jgi:hypothetical protein
MLIILYFCTLKEKINNPHETTMNTGIHKVVRKSDFRVLSDN